MRNRKASFRRLSDVLEYLVDPRVGIVRYVQEVPRQAGAPDFFHYRARACNTRAFSRQANFSRTGGASAERDVAIAKAIGEAVERYCAALFEAEELPLTSYRDAPFRCVPPGDFALYSPEQYARPDFPFVPFGDVTPVRWAPALDPLTGETWHVPAAMVFLPYFYYEGTGDSPIVLPISTGLACHCSPAEAAASALCEVIERDAFTITWQARLGRAHVRVDTLSPRNRELVQRFQRAGCVITLLNVTMDVGVPTVLAVARHRSPEAPALVVAASAHPDPEQAVRKSLEELEHTRSYAQGIKRDLPRLDPGAGYDNIVVGQQSHLNFWCDHANAPLAEFLFASDERCDFREMEDLATGDPGRDLEALLRKVRAVNHRALVADLTTPDVRELGLTVVRAVIPGFHPLALGHADRARGGSRLWEVPRKLGYPGITRPSGDNPIPHPFP